MSKSDQKRNTSEPPYDGFFTSSIASANESTGYAVTVPETEDQARELSDLGKNPNTESTAKSKKNKKKR